MQGLAELNAGPAKSVPFRNLAEFDKFMLDDGTALRLERFTCTDSSTAGPRRERRQVTPEERRERPTR
jgi:hypothetical protein